MIVGISTQSSPGGDSKCCWSYDYCVTTWDLAEGLHTITEIPQDGWTNTDPTDVRYQNPVYVPYYEEDAGCDGGIWPSCPLDWVVALALAVSCGHNP
jgi:hypothetical protein